MALTIEDGTIVADADSYATIAELTTYAANYGFTVPATDAEKESLLRRAFLQMNAERWKGTRVEAEQSGAWPRTDVYVDSELLSAVTIPARIQYGQMALACEIYQDDQSLAGAGGGAAVTELSVKVDVIERTQKFDLARRNDGHVLPAAPDRQSRAQFADYLQARGLFAVRA